MYLSPEFTRGESTPADCPERAISPGSVGPQAVAVHHSDVSLTIASSRFSTKFRNSGV